jgi:hypothetical protein
MIAGPIIMVGAPGHRKVRGAWRRPGEPGLVQFHEGVIPMAEANSMSSLPSTVQRLNDLTAQANKTIEEFEKMLRSLDVGGPVWLEPMAGEESGVDIDGQDDRNESRATVSYGWYKCHKHWCIVIARGDSDQVLSGIQTDDWDKSPDVEMKPLLHASRRYRLAAIRSLPQLAQQVIERVASIDLSQVEDAIREARGFLKSQQGK